MTANATYTLQTFITLVYVRRRMKHRVATFGNVSSGLGNDVTLICRRRFERFIFRKTVSQWIYWWMALGTRSTGITAEPMNRRVERKEGY